MKNKMFFPIRFLEKKMISKKNRFEIKKKEEIEIKKLFHEENVLITGTCGSIGSAFTKRILNFNYKNLYLLDKDEGNLVISNIRKSLFDSEDDQLKETLYVLEFGKEQVIKADLLHKEGLKFFDEKKYDKAAEKFYKAAILNPLELPYYENAANAYLQISNHEKTLEMVNYIIDNSKKPNGKAYYLKAIVYLEKENRILACEFLTQSKKLGFNGANNVYRSFCK